MPECIIFGLYSFLLFQPFQRIVKPTIISVMYSFTNFITYSIHAETADRRAVPKIPTHWAVFSHLWIIHFTSLTLLYGTGDRSLSVLNPGIPGLAGSVRGSRAECFSG